MKKKGFLLATSAGFAAAAAPGAQAADMPLKAPSMVAPAASWAGWYIGVHAGVNWQQAHDNFDVGNGYGSGTFSTTATGFIGGGQLGYNWQHGNFVFGIEGDGSGLSGKGSGHSGAPATPYGTVSNSVRWLSTVRARFGLAVGDTMAYTTAGVAFGGVRNTFTNNSGAITYSDSKTKTGWAVGGGIEHMLNRNWTIGLEGLFVDLGRSNSVAGVRTNGTTTVKTTSFSNQAVIGRLKLNYKF
jgi:outer membrane immunogenic protein